MKKHKHKFQIVSIEQVSTMEEDVIDGKVVEWMSIYDQIVAACLCGKIKRIKELKKKNENN